MINCFLVELTWCNSTYCLPMLVLSFSVLQWGWFLCNIFTSTTLVASWYFVPRFFKINDTMWDALDQALIYFLIGYIYFSFNFQIKKKTRTLDATLYDNVWQWLVAGRWFSPGTPVSSTNKTDRHDITEILF